MKICILSCFGDLTLKDTGSSVRIHYLAKSLADLGNEVHIVIPGNKAAFKSMDKMVIHSISGFCPIKILKFISNLIGALRANSLFLYDISFILRAYPLILKSDIVQIEQPWAGGLIIPFVTKILKKPLVVDSHDTFQALRVKHTGILRKILEVFLEKIAYRFADMILTVSEKDKEFLIKYGVQQDKIAVITNGVDPDVFSPLLDTTQVQDRYNLTGFYKVVFVGNMEYTPNQEAVHVITRNLAPKIQKTINNVKFLIVGRVPNSIFRDITSKSSIFVFTGTVESIVKFLVASDVAIAPLLHGSGSRLKILEYFSCGLPVVSTTVGMEGLEAENGVNALIEDDMDEFAVKVTNLLKDNVLSMRLGKAARELVISKYDWRKIGRQLNEVYHTMLPNRINMN